MKRILVVGDSWSSAREEDTGFDLGWPEALGIPAYLRQAVPGSRACDWASDFSGRLTAALKTDCDCVVMSLLGNDALEALSDGNITPEEVSNALLGLRSVVTKLLGRHYDVFVLLYTNPFVNDPVKGLGVALLNLAIQKSCPDRTKFIMTSDALGNEDFIGGIHPTKEGWNKVARLIMRCVES